MAIDGKIDLFIASRLHPPSDGGALKLLAKLSMKEQRVFR